VTAEPVGPRGRGIGSPGRRRRALGQHFLVDPGVGARIVEAVGATAADVVCEIGAGRGVLTRALAARAGHLVALEIDPALRAGLARAARGWPSAARVEIRLADARGFPYETLGALRPATTGRVLVVGNLPYSASKPILERLLAAHATLHAAVLMLQREVGERLAATPGGRAYGALSVVWQLWAEVTLLEVVPAAAFQPPPAVESAVIRAAFRSVPHVPIADEAAFMRVVRAAFGQRRKTLSNALRGGGLGSPERLAAALVTAAIDGRRRAETLALAEFARLAAALGGHALTSIHAPPRAGRPRTSRPDPDPVRAAAAPDASDIVMGDGSPREVSPP
jgi:16S rRNA (adenine1518-N6/adenine1519-N6)-dimethyltransferase